jgi:hypothetical protein
VDFITKFEDFADPNVPYMYHCHLLPHEDDGMMGSFRVIDVTTKVIEPESEKSLFTFLSNPVSDYLSIQFAADLKGHFTISVFDLVGHKMIEQQIQSSQDNILIPTSEWNSGLYIIFVKNGLRTSVQRICVHHI